MADKDDWHLDKRISIGLLFSTFAIIVTLAGQAYWVGQFTGEVTQRIEQVERRLEDFAVRNAVTDREVAQQGEEIATLTVEIKNLTKQLERLYIQGESTNQLLRQMLTPNGIK